MKASHRVMIPVAISFASAMALHAQQAPLVYLESIPLMDVAGRIDHLAVDSDRQRLFVAALGNNSVEVVDLAASKRVKSVPGFHEPQGIRVTKVTVAVANGESGDVQLIDAATLRLTTTVRLGGDADNVRYDPEAGRLFVGYGDGAIASLDASSGKRLGTVPLPAHPESFQIERNGKRLFVNVPNAGGVIAIDRQAMRVLTTWPLAGARANYPMALDETHHRLFIGCRQPARVLILDTRDGRVAGSVDVVGDTDDLFYDERRKRVYVSGGAGFIDVLQQSDPDHLERTARIPTRDGARTSLFVAELDRLYVACPRRNGKDAEIRVYAVRD